MFNISFTFLILMPFILPLLHPNTNASGLPLSVRLLRNAWNMKLMCQVHMFIIPDKSHLREPVHAKEFLELPNNRANSQPFNELASCQMSN
jgi:hypothetical protein